MGGKSYFCDYCRCYLKNDVNVRKKHNSGLMHTIAKFTYMRRYEDPRKVLAEEQKKPTCVRYLKGYCRFDLFCQFTHFSLKQMQQLQKIVTKLEQQASKTHANTEKAAEWEKLLPWYANANRKATKLRKQTLKRLPQSLKAINFNKINEDCLNVEWGC